MVRRMVLVGGLLCLASVAATATDAPSLSAKLSAAQVVERNAAARGGLAAWKAVQTLSLSGQMDAGGNETPARLAAPGVKAAGAQLPKRPAAQARLPFRMELKRGRKSRLEIDFRGETAVQVYDGAHGWKLRPFLNRHEVEPFTPDEIKATALQSDLDGPLLDHESKGTKVEMEGTEKIEGNDAYRLKLTFKNGQSQHLWVDAKTFLETKIEGTPRRLDSKMHTVEVYYRNYKSVNGLMMPMVLETRVQGVKQVEKIEIEKLVVNPQLDDARFAKLQ